MKIGILGGTFDPIHEGHLTLARESVKQFDLDKVLFVPAHIPPHKRKDEEISRPSYRARMVELATVEEPRWELCDLELRRPGVSYTVDTLRELRKTFPSPHELFFMAGADSLQDIQNWKDPEEIFKLSEWVVAPRPSFMMPNPLPPRVHWLNMPLMDISASELREKIRKGEDVSRWIPSKVLTYIQQTKIYGQALR